MYNISVSRSYLDDCTCSLTKQNIALNDLFYATKILIIKMKNI